MKYLTKEFFLAATVFSKELFGFGAGDSVIDLYQIGIAAVGFVLIFRPKPLFRVVATLAAIIGVSLVLFNLYDYPISSMFVRQAAAVSFIYIGTASYLLSCSPEQLTIGYVRVCFWAAVIGILQVALSVAGIDILIRVPMRLDSLAGEPSHYAVAVAPCVYYCLRYHRTWLSKVRTATILASLVLTVSATAVAVVSVAFALAFYSRRGVIAVMLFVIIGPTLLTIPPEIFPEVIGSRVTSMQQYAETDGDPWDTTNLTVLSYATNFEVMVSTFTSGRLLGNGFCGHVAAYQLHFEDTEFTNHRRYGINAPAAHCLVIRILSEFGMLGAILIATVIWNSVSNRRSDLWSMFFTMALVGRAFKLGSWIDYGLPIFVLCAVYFSNPKPASNVSGTIRSDPPKRSLVALET